MNLTYYISQYKCFLQWFFNCFCFSQVFKIAYVINQTDSASTSKIPVLIVLSSVKCRQLSRFKAKCYKDFISLELCELIREKCDECLSFILHALFNIVILIYSSLNVAFSLNLKVCSYIFSYIYMPFVIKKYWLFCRF